MDVSESQRLLRLFLIFLSPFSECLSLNDFHETVFKFTDYCFWYVQFDLNLLK